MKWSLKVGRILGIDVYIHLTFLLLLGFVGLASWLNDRTVAAAAGGVVFFVSLFICVLLHEYGHALAARRFGIATRDITLLPIGGVARLERVPEKPLQELWVAIAGPLVNVVIATGLFLGLQLSGSWQPLSSLSTTQGSLLERLLVVNVFLVLFNLIPAFPMDGGRVLRALLAMRMEYARATRIAANIGQGIAFVFGFIGLFTNPMLLFIAFFVWIGAGQEAAAAQMRSSFAGFLVRDAMLTEFKTLAPGNTLGEAARLLLAGSQRDFPVVADGQVAGMLPHTELFKALKEHGESAPVSSVMHRGCEMLDANELLDWAVSHMRPDAGTSYPVLRRGQLVGLLTAENIGEFFMVRAALADRPRATPPPLPGVPPVIRTPHRYAQA
jgi:Zn-dependent protease/CBS domain-containing protein